MFTDQQNGMIFCNLPFSSGTHASKENKYVSKLSTVFDFLNQRKHSNLIEHYAVSQTTLEQIFLRLAGYDKNDDDDSIVQTIVDEPSDSNGKF